MRIAVIDSFKNIKIRYKISLFFIILALLITNLSALNIFSVKEIQKNTEEIGASVVPTVLHTSRVKDNLNEAIFSAYEYVQQGKNESKLAYQVGIQNAVSAELDLFSLAQTEEDFEFVKLFEDQINGIYAALSTLVELYESGASETTIERQLAVVSERQEAFARFLEKEVDTEVAQIVENERSDTQSQVNLTLINVAIVGSITVLVAIFMYWMAKRSLTDPIQELTALARDIGKNTFRISSIDSQDEIGVLAETFNTTTQRIKATQESLMIELEKTKRLDRQKTEFLSIAAHQLRTPISGIKWAVNMAAEGDLGEVSDDAKEQLKKTVENIDRMIVIINGLLNVTELEVKGADYEKEPVNVVTMLQSLVEEFFPIAQQAEVHVKLNEDISSEGHFIMADKEKIMMAIRNLIDNGIKYTPKGGTVQISVQEDRTDVQIHIADSGYGVPEKEQDRLFTKFYRGSNIQQVQADGSGLGLYITKQIVDQHNGDITFTSVVDQGTTFTVELPKTDERPKPVEIPETKEEPAAEVDSSKDASETTNSEEAS